MKGKFAVTPSTGLSVLVGGQGESKSYNGGGGSFNAGTQDPESSTSFESDITPPPFEKVPITEKA